MSSYMEANQATTEVGLKARTRNGPAPMDWVRIMARTTACSSAVLSGLLAWASLCERRVRSRS